MANRITTIFDFKERGSGLKKIKADVAGVDGAFNKAKVTAKGAWAEFAGNRAAQAAVAGMALALGKRAIDAASDLEESINAVNVTFGSAADEIHRFGETSVESFGLSRRAFNEAAVMFSAFAQTVAGEGGNSAAVIDEITRRAADFASVYNIEVSEAMRVFQSALAGEQEPIKRYGKNLSAAAVELYALRKGLIANKSEMTEAIKVQARYGLLLEETTAVSGDFKNTQDSMANASKTLSQRVEDLTARLGKQLIPVAEEAVGIMNDVAEATEDAADAGSKLPGGFEALKTGFDWVNPVRYINMYNDGMVSLGRSVGIVGSESRDATAPILGMASAMDEQITSIVTGGVEALEGRRKTLELAEAYKSNAKEATYNADALDEMRRIQKITNGIVEDAADAQREYLESIKHTRDEVGKLKREIDDQQAWITMLDAFDRTEETLADTETTTREAYSAVLELKEGVIQYGEETLNLPDEVITRLIAQIDAGKVAEVEAFLQRMQNGVTLPIRPEVRNSFNASSAARGGPTLTAEGNLIPSNARAMGGPVRAGETYLVGERGPELLTMGGNGYVTPNHALPSVNSGGGGVSIGQVVVQAPAGANPDEFGRLVREAIRRETRWAGPVTGWAAA